MRSFSKSNFIVSPSPLWDVTWGSWVQTFQHSCGFPSSLVRQSNAWPLVVGPTVCPWKSATNYNPKYVTSWKRKGLKYAVAEA